MHRSNRPLLSSGLAGLTLLILLTHLPDGGMDLTTWLGSAALVALLIGLGASLGELRLSLALTGSLLSYLTFGDRAGALWATAAGAVVGNLWWFWRLRPARGLRLPHRVLIEQIANRSAQLLLGLFAGAWVYEQLDSRLPLDRFTTSDLLRVLILLAADLAVYVVVFVLEARWQGRPTLRILTQNRVIALGALLLALPLMIAAAVAYHRLSDLVFGLLVFGLIMAAAGVRLGIRIRARNQQQVAQLSLLSAITHAMRTNIGQDALLTLVYQEIHRQLKPADFIVALLDLNRNMLQFPLHMRYKQPVVTPPRELHKGLYETVIQEKRALLLPDQVQRRAGDLRIEPPPIEVHSWLGVPLLAPDRVLGCLAVESHTPGQRFTTDDLHLLTIIAAQTAIALDNTQLYKEAHDRSVQLATLNNVAATLSGTLDVEQVLDLTLSSALAVAGSDAATLYMWQENGYQLPRLARCSGLSDTFSGDEFRPLLAELHDLERRRQPLIVADVQTDHRTPALRASMEREHKRAWIELLLRKGDELLGILILFYDEPRSFRPEEIELLRNFTSQAALAISNARLYTQTDQALTRRLEQLSALGDIGQEITSILSLPGLFQMVLDRAIEATQSQTGALVVRTNGGETRPSVVAQHGFPPDIFASASPLVGPIEYTFQTGYPTLLADVSLAEDYVPLDPRTRAQLNVPILHGEDVLGVIALGSDQINAYGMDDLSFVSQLAVQARIAIDNAQLFRRVEVERDRLQVILDSMKEGVILIGAQSEITLANPRVKRLLGLNPEQLIGESVHALIEGPLPDLAARLGFSVEALFEILRSLDANVWDETSRDGQRVTFQIPASQERFIDRTDAPVRDDKGRVIGLLMVFADVTEEHQLAQAREDLGSMIVHDLRGPLTAITTSLKLLNELASPEDSFGKIVVQTTETSSRAVRKLLNMVDSLLDVSKMEGGVTLLEREPAELMPVVRTVLDELNPLAYELEVAIEVELPPDLPPLNIDVQKIERVLFNLVDNAIKFTPGEGQVIIRAYPPGSRNAGEGLLRVEVQDNGPGIADEFKERLFDRFAQLNGQPARRRGTGLGLTFCKLTIQAHGGTIWIEDNPAGGAIFAFTLPVMQMGATADDEG
ncbi:MAG: GAF domain-containing protein [Chloroflexi bacterium]|nr:GAF domain-containing protein [Chloroflexota bacterium]